MKRLIESFEEFSENKFQYQFALPIGIKPMLEELTGKLGNKRIALSDWDFYLDKVQSIINDSDVNIKEKYFRWLDKIGLKDDDEGRSAFWLDAVHTILFFVSQKKTVPYSKRPEFVVNPDELKAALISQKPINSLGESKLGRLRRILNDKYKSTHRDTQIKFRADNIKSIDIDVNNYSIIVNLVTNVELTEYEQDHFEKYDLHELQPVYPSFYNKKEIVSDKIPKLKELSEYSKLYSIVDYNPSVQKEYYSGSMDWLA